MLTINFNVKRDSQETNTQWALSMRDDITLSRSEVERIRAESHKQLEKDTAEITR